METLRKYIEEWILVEGQKPINEAVFIEAFIDLVANLKDEDDIVFDGNGAYFGKQVTLRLNSYWYQPDPLIYFEIAYSQDKISVYTGNHYGFWTPEYLNMTPIHPRFMEVQRALFTLLRRVFGLTPA